MSAWRTSPFARGSRARQVLLASLATLLCADCALPLAPDSQAPGFYGSPTDLSNALPAFIEIGKTTRDEITRRLGRAAVQAPDERWFYYESNYLKSESGAYTLVTSANGGFFDRWPLGSEVQLRRLWIRFDAAGVVDEATFQSADCDDLIFNSGDLALDPPFSDEALQRCPLLQRDTAVHARRLEDRRRMASAALDVPDSLQWFSGGHWKTGDSTRFRPCRLRRGPAEGDIGVSPTSVILLPLNESAPFVGPNYRPIPRSEVADTGFTQGLSKPQPGVYIQLADGERIELFLCRGDGVDRDRVQALHDLLLQTSQP